MVINSLIMRNYKTLLNENKSYFDLKVEDFKLTEEQKTSIYNYINNSGMQLAGVTYNIFDPEICKYAMFVYVKLKEKDRDTGHIEIKIRDLIGEFFTDIKSDIFIPKSDIVHLLKSNIDEIDGVSVYFLSEQNERALQTKTYTTTEYVYNASKNAYEKKIKTIYLYDKENPNLGLDNHGNIYLQSDTQFPILKGGWNYLSEISQKEGQDTQEICANALTIIFE